jgi:uncharacterized protein YaeQ
MPGKEGYDLIMRPCTFRAEITRTRHLSGLHGTLPDFPEFVRHPSSKTMALKSTIHKANLQIADMDRAYYADHALTIARHPSETDERMMMRLFAFAAQAAENLVFARGLSDEDEPDLWRRDLTGAVEQWIEVGQPDERRLLKACGRAAEVVIYAYSNSCDIWWRGLEGKVARARNLQVWKIAPEESAALAALAERSMQLQITVQEGEAWVGNGETVAHLCPIRLK